LSYFDSSPSQASQRKYKYVASADLEMDDTMLRKGKGYWLYGNEAGNLTLPGVGGSYGNETYAWNKLRFMNASGYEAGIGDVGSAGLGLNWIETTLQYWGLDEFGDLPYDFKYLGPTDDGYRDYIYPWEGVFVKSLKDNITLIRQN